MRDGASAGFFAGPRSGAYAHGVRHRGNWRLFVAIHPPAQTGAALLDALASLPLPEHRATPAGQVHLTLQFVGDTAEVEVERVAESVSRSVAGISPFSLRAERFITLPRTPPGRRAREAPRLLAALTDAPPELLEIQRRLAHRLARSVRERPGEGFVPHMTLCRFRDGSVADAVDRPTEGPGAAPFGVGEVRLMRSVLSPAGASHAEVERFPLGPG